MAKNEGRPLYVWSTRYCTRAERSTTLDTLYADIGGCDDMTLLLDLVTHISEPEMAVSLVVW